MTQQKTIAQGAEAIILLNNNQITKDRIPKSYRLKELDDKIRKRRTKSETKLLEKASSIINSPIPEPQKDKFKIQMPYIDGKKLSDHLDSFPLAKQKQICKQIGESIAKIHDANIIHGDLTTSNMIYIPQQGDDEKIKSQTPLKKSSPLITSSAKKSGKADFEAINRASAPIIFFIDFGLGFISHKYEDKAVDIHLLRQALEAKHFKHWQELFDEVIKGYKQSQDFKIVLERLKAVEKRGRYKH